MGGLGGKIKHFYDDNDLKITELETYLYNLNKTFKATEKVDGINIFFSFINNEIRFARNKSQIDYYGDNSLTLNEIQEKFKNRGTLSQSINESTNYLAKVFRNYKSFFANGIYWINCEIISICHPKTIKYEKNYIVIHNLNQIVIEYDTNNLTSTSQYLKEIPLTNSLVRKIKYLYIWRDVFNFNPNKYHIRFSLPKEYNGINSLSYEKLIKTKFKTINNLYGNEDGELKIYDIKYAILKEEKQFKTLPKIYKKYFDLFAKRFIDQDKTIKYNSKEFDGCPLELINTFKQFEKETTFSYLSNWNIFIRNIIEIEYDALRNLVENKTNKFYNNISHSYIYDIFKISDELKNDFDLLQKYTRQLTMIPDKSNIEMNTEGLIVNFNNKKYKLTGIYPIINRILGLPIYRK